MNCTVFLDGKTYSNNHRLVKEIVLDATRQYFPMEEFNNGPSKCATILDLGCGTCENTKWFASQVGAQHVVGIDWNRNFLDYAAQHVTGLGCDGIGGGGDGHGIGAASFDLRHVNLNEASWHAGLPELRYDLITSFLTLHWVKNLTACFDSLKRLATPGRTLMFHVIGIRPGQNFQATIRTLAGTEKWGHIIKAFMHATRWQDPTIADWRTGPDPAGAFRDILETAGFSVSICAKMAFTYTTESEAECRGHLQWLVPFTAELPASEQAALMDDFMSVYQRFTRQDGPGRYVWENEVLVVLARVAE